MKYENLSRIYNGAKSVATGIVVALAGCSDDYDNLLLKTPGNPGKCNESTIEIYGKEPAEKDNGLFKDKKILVSKLVRDCTIKTILFTKEDGTLDRVYFIDEEVKTPVHQGTPEYDAALNSLDKAKERSHQRLKEGLEAIVN